MVQILIDGMKIEYHASGSGQDILLLHGWGVDSSTMEPMRLHLAEYCHAVSVDLPGFGGSEEPPFAWTVYDYADFVERLIEKLGLKDPILLGHSFGGRLSIILGSRGVGSRLILTDAAGIIPKRSWKYYVRVYSYKAAKKVFSIPFLRPLKDKVLRIWVKNNPSSDYANAQGVMRKIFVQTVNEDLQPLLEKIKKSTLLIWGADDTATPLSDGKLMEQLIPDAGLVVFEECGHYPFLQQPRRFYNVIDYFITH